VPDAVKLTAVKLLKEQAPGRELKPQTYSAAAKIIALLLTAASEEELTAQVEKRMASALRKKVR